tara:strand:- start:282 stop:599 length:318 start_codon:yes stop_codon:yes gene_type:complete
MAEHMIRKSGDGDDILTIGSLEWSPTEWSYTTSDPVVENLLSVVKENKEVEGMVSVLEGDTQFSFVPRIFGEADPAFVGQLGDYLGRVHEIQAEPSVWLKEVGGQ